MCCNCDSDYMESVGQVGKNGYFDTIQFPIREQGIALLVCTILSLLIVVLQTRNAGGAHCTLVSSPQTSPLSRPMLHPGQPCGSYYDCRTPVSNNYQGTLKR